MKKINSTLLIFTILLFLTNTCWGQTNPTAQSLPYSQDFSSLQHSSTTYPAGWQGWKLSTSPGPSFYTLSPTEDRTLTASSTAGTTSGNVHNYDGKIGYLNSASLDLTIVIAIITTGFSNIQVNYDIMTIRNPYDGTNNTRINEVTLQYRVGTTGEFTNLTGIEYQNNTTTQTSGTTPQNLQTKTIILPSECNNKPVIQLRWASRQVSGSGSRPSFAVDNISIYETRPSIQANSIIFTSVTTSTFIVNWTDGNGMKRAVFIKQSNTGTASPVDNTTYTANTEFGNGTQIGSTGWYCIFNGTTHESGVTVTKLSPETDYIVMVCEYNGESGSEKYNTNSLTDNPKYQTTSSASTHTITTGTVFSPPFCVNANNSTTGTITYTSTGSYSSSIFTAYLSNASGNFDIPINVGTASVSGINPSGSINITIPAASSSGISYKIRIDCNNPSITGNTSSTFEIINGVKNISSPSGTASNTQVSLNWTNPTGCYDEIMIVAKSSYSITGSPSGDGSSYSANLVFGTTGTEYGIGDGYVVYKGITSGQTVTSLSNGITYYFKFFTRKGTNWSSGDEINLTPDYVTIGDYRSIQSGNWGTTVNWEKFNGTTWAPADVVPEITNNVTIRNGHIIKVEASGKNCNNLVVENGGKLYVNLPTTTNRYINVYGNISCNGIIGNGSTNDGISFNIEGTNCVISGSGSFDASRIRKSTNNNSVTILTISRDVNLCYGGTAIYNDANSTTFDIIINSGVTLNCLGDGITLGSLAVSGINASSSNGTKWGSITVNGVLNVSNLLYLTSYTTTNPVMFTIGITGIVNASELICSSSGSAGHILNINNGGKLNITGANGISVFSTTNNTYNLNNGSFIEYSYEGSQIIRELNYSNLILSGSGTKILSGNTVVNGIISLNNGLLQLGSNNLILSSSASISDYSTSNYIVTDGTGVLKRNNIGSNEKIFPVGTTDTYSPVWITNNGTEDNFSVRVEPDATGSNGGEDRIKLKWEISEDVIGGSDLTLKFGWMASQEGMNFTSSWPDYAKLWHVYNEQWVEAGTGDYTYQRETEPYTMQRSGITSLSPFAGGKDEAALPVELASFSSNANKNDVTLNWITSNEINNYGFEIERKENTLTASEWKYAGFVKGSGTTNETKNYSFVDRNLQSGKYKYRLKQIDYNGNFQYFELNGLVEIGTPQKYYLSQNYPNPFNPVTKIDYELPYDGKIVLKIYDITGREISALVNDYKQAGYHSVEFNASTLASGVYFYRITANDFTSVKRMVLIR